MAQYHIRFLVIALGVFGILYPICMGGIGQFLFPWQTNGSLIYVNDRPVGSFLIGQDFSSEKYFHNRAKASHDSFIHTPSYILSKNPEFKPIFENTEAAQKELDLPSGSGIDPFITFTAAKAQVHRVAKARNLKNEVVLKLLKKRKIHQYFGDDLVHLLHLNIELDHLK